MTEISAEALCAHVESHRDEHIANLVSYFSLDANDPMRPHNRTDFTGGRFEFLGGGGDAASRDTVTAGDLIAVECLSVQFPIRAKLMLLEGDVGVRVNDLLKQIDADKDLHEYEVTPLGRSSPAWKAWDEIHDSLHDVGAVLTSKLLSRKRPRLIPIYDDVLRCALKLKLGATGQWEWIHPTLRANHNELASLLNGIRSEGSQLLGLLGNVSTLRTLDVMVWMIHRIDHRDQVCTAPLGWRG